MWFKSLPETTTKDTKLDHSCHNVLPSVHGSSLVLNLYVKTTSLSRERKQPCQGDSQVVSQFSCALKRTFHTVLSYQIVKVNAEIYSPKIVSHNVHTHLHPHIHTPDLNPYSPIHPHTHVMTEVEMLHITPTYMLGTYPRSINNLISPWNDHSRPKNRSNLSTTAKLTKV